MNGECCWCLVFLCIEFPEFFLRFLVLLLLLLYVPPLCTWILRSSLFTRDTINTLPNNTRVNTNNFLGIIDNWPFKYMTNQLILPRQYTYGIVQWAKQLLCGSYQQFITPLTPNLSSFATIITTTKHTESISFANYILTLKQSVIYSYSLIATIITIFPNTRSTHLCHHNYINQPSTNRSLRRILKYYIIVLLLTRIIPRAITPCTAFNMSLDNNNSNPPRPWWCWPRPWTRPRSRCTTWIQHSDLCWYFQSFAKHWKPNRHSLYSAGYIGK